MAGAEVGTSQGVNLDESFYRLCEAIHSSFNQSVPLNETCQQEDIENLERFETDRLEIIRGGADYFALMLRWNPICSDSMSKLRSDLEHLSAQASRIVNSRNLAGGLPSREDCDYSGLGHA